MTLRIALTGLLLLTAFASHAMPPIPDTPFWQDEHERHPLASPAENDVRRVALDRAGRVWAATAAGVRVLQDGKWKTPAGGDLGPTYALALDPRGEVLVGAWNGIFTAAVGGVTRAGLDGKPIGALRASPDGAFFAAGPGGIWRREGAKWTPMYGRWVGGIRALETEAGGVLWIATASGLYRLDTEKGESVRLGRPEELLSSDVRSLRRAPDGTLWVGSSGGIDLYNGTTRRRSFTGREQEMPFRLARAIAFAPDGRAWVATPAGACRYDGSGWALRHSLRWLLSDDVRDVAIGPDGTAWLATAQGVSAIRRTKMTLAQKAQTFLALFRKYQIRPPGLVGPANLAIPGDLSRFSVGDTDNDGSLTAYACVFESYRYAVTKDPQARANAKEAFHALEFLQTVTGTRHFVARTAVPIDVPPLNDLNHEHTPPEVADIHLADPRYKPVDIRWRPSADGKWLWKGDTSSDEITAHLFAWAIYFDLAADEAEKARVAALVDTVVGGIVDDGFVLKDTDGTHTRWAVWSPEKLNGDENWREERGINSAEMLSYLNAALHITGKAKYRAAKDLLIQKHGYAQNTLRIEYHTPSEHTYIDDSLLPMAWPSLLEYETDPALSAVFQASLRLWHREIARDGRGHYDFVFNRYAGATVPLEPAIEELREWPLDLIEWTVDNSRREDIAFDRTPGRDEGIQIRRLPASERGLTETDGDPKQAVRGNGGRRLHTSYIWLLDYWQARYFGFLAAPEKEK